MAAPMVSHAICQNLSFSRKSTYLINCVFRQLSVSKVFSRQRNKLPLRHGRQPRNVFYLNEDNQVQVQDSLKVQRFTPQSATEWPYAEGRPPTENVTHKVINSRNIQNDWKSNVNKIKAKTMEDVKHIGTMQKPKKGKGKLKLYDKNDQTQSLDDLDKVNYELLDEGDKRFGQLVMLAKSRKQREKGGIILLEGHRLITDAILAGAVLECLYFTKLEHLHDIPIRETDAALYKVRYQHMKIWSDVETPPGIMAICRLPQFKDLEINTEALFPITLVCDNIRDPGNMGTILRAAAAAGCQSVLATTGCVDIWAPKVLRAGAGCHFRTRVINNLGWQMLGTYIPDEAQVFLADCNNTDVNEPLLPPSASVAQQISEEDSETYTMLDEETGEVLHIDEGYLNTDTVQLYKQFPLAMSHYFDAVIDNKKPTVLVIGGETEGLSSEAHKLAFQKNGERLIIPMNDGVDSLNSAMAASVILFDIKKRYMVTQG